MFPFSTTLVFITIVSLSLISLPFAWTLSTNHQEDSSQDSLVRVIQTSKAGDRWKDLGDVAFDSGRNSSLPLLDVDSSTSYQKIVGFGGAFTDSVAQVYFSLSAAARERVLELIFSDDGLRYTLGRLTIGSCDFSVGSYSYDDTDGDYSMQHFSIAHDEEKIIPLIHAAMNVSHSFGRNINFLACPWSAPAWMKRNHHMRNSEKPGLIQDPKIFSAYALYLSKYVSAMTDHGIDIWALSVQNEPHVAGQFLVTYECCGYNATNMYDFLLSYLGPQMRSDHPNVKLFIYDDQRPDMVEFVQTVMSDSRVKSFVDGVGFRWYGGFLEQESYNAVHTVAKNFKDLILLGTEATLEAYWKQLDHWKQGAMYAQDIIRDLNAGAQGWMDWNFLLDADGGPQHALGPCDAPLRRSTTSSSEIIIGNQYYQFGHFSRYLPPGSVLVQTSLTSMPDNVWITSLKTPSGDRVTVILNDNTFPIEYQLRADSGSFATLSIPALATQTLIF